MHQAGKYVISLLPNPLEDRVQIQHLFIPSIDLGGDIFDYYWLDEKNLVIYLLDVAGHGVRPALLSVSVRNILRSLRDPLPLRVELRKRGAQTLLNTDFYEPNTVVSELNRMFQMDEKGENYFTIWYGVYNILEQKLVYCSAAHPPAVLIYTTENNQIEIQQLSNENVPVGMLRKFEFEQSSCYVKQGSSLYLFSDGVYEIPRSDKETWGINALAVTLQNHYRNSRLDPNNYKSHPPLTELLQKIKQINSQETFNDDFSLIEVNFNGLRF